MESLIVCILRPGTPVCMSIVLGEKEDEPHGLQVRVCFIWSCWDKWLDLKR